MRRCWSQGSALPQAKRFLAWTRAGRAAGHGVSEQAVEGIVLGSGAEDLSPSRTPCAGSPVAAQGSASAFIRRQALTRCQAARTGRLWMAAACPSPLLAQSPPPYTGLSMPLSATDACRLRLGRSRLAIPWGTARPHRGACPGRRRAGSPAVPIDTIGAYARGFREFAEAYEALGFEEIHRDAIPFLPRRPAWCWMSAPAAAATPPGSPAAAGRWSPPSPPRPCGRRRGACTPIPPSAGWTTGCRRWPRCTASASASTWSG